MKKRFTEEQIIGFLREAEAGLPVKDLCRRHGFSEASYYLWRSKFGGMSVPDAKRLKELEAENTRLKKLLAEQMLGFTPKPRTVVKGWKTSDPAWRLFAASSGCGTARCIRTHQPLLHRVSGMSCGRPARA